MTNEAQDGVTVLLLRDPDGNLYAITEDTIRAHRATPEQQATVKQALGDQDVSGFVGFGGFGPVGGINITTVVAPQINVATGLNLAILSPGASQVLGQVQGNQFFAFR